MLSRIGKEFQVNTVNDGVRMPRIAILNDDNFVSIWKNSSGVLNGQILTSSGSKIGTKFEISSLFSSPRETIYDVARLNNNNFVVSYITSRTEVYGQIYTFSGSKLGGEFRINQVGGALSTELFSPRISTFTNNNFVVSWWGYDQVEFDTYFFSYSQIFSSTGSKFGNQIPVNNSASSSGTQDASIKVLKNNNFVISTSARKIDQSDYDILAQVFSSTGNKVGSELLVNTFTTGDQSDPIVEGFSNSNFVIAWESINNDHEIFGQIFTSSGSKIGNEFQVNTNLLRIGLTGQKGIATLNNDNFIVVWQGNNQDDMDIICGQMFNDQGDKLGDEFALSLGGSVNTDPQVASLFNNNFIITWVATSEENPTSAIYGQIYGSSTISTPLPNIVSPSMMLNSPSIDPDRFQVSEIYNIDREACGGISSVHTLENEFIINWIPPVNISDTSDGNHLQIFSSEATKIGNEIIIPGFTNMAILSDGNIAVVNNRLFTSNTTAYSSSFDLIGGPSPVKAEEVSLITGRPIIAASNSGNYIVAWSKVVQKDLVAYKGIFGHIFSNSGASQTSEFSINTRQASTENEIIYPPEATGLKNGNFLVAWRALLIGDGELFAQIITPRGGKVGSEFQIYSESPSNERQQLTAVHSISNGNFVVLWSNSYYSPGPSGPVLEFSEPYLRFFSADGFPLGNAFPINVTTHERLGNDVEKYFPTDIIELTEDNLVVAFRLVNSTQAYYGQLLASNGSKLNEEFLITQDDSLKQVNITGVRLAALNDNKFVAVWGENFNNCRQYVVLGKIYDGTKLAETPGENGIPSSATRASPFLSPKSFYNYLRLNSYAALPLSSKPSEESSYIHSSDSEPTISFTNILEPAFAQLGSQLALGVVLWHGVRSIYNWFTSTETTNNKKELENANQEQVEIITGNLQDKLDKMSRKLSNVNDGEIEWAEDAIAYYGEELFKLQNKSYVSEAELNELQLDVANLCQEVRSEFQFKTFKTNPASNLNINKGLNQFGFYTNSSVVNSENLFKPQTLGDKSLNYIASKR